MRSSLPTVQNVLSHVVELHYVRPVFSSMFHITGSKDANAFLRLVINKKQLDLKECFWIILTTFSNRILSVSEVSKGSTRCVNINLREILQLALLSNVSAIIIAHNHPSGNLNPSETDKRLTNQLIKALALIDITLLDHLILTSEGYTSFSDNHLL